MAWNDDVTKIVLATLYDGLLLFFCHDYVLLYCGGQSYSFILTVRNFLLRKCHLNVVFFPDEAKMCVFCVVFSLKSITFAQ